MHILLIIIRICGFCHNWKNSDPWDFSNVIVKCISLWKAFKVSFYTTIGKLAILGNNWKFLKNVGAKDCWQSFKINRKWGSISTIDCLLGSVRPLYIWLHFTFTLIFWAMHMTSMLQMKNQVKQLGLYFPEFHVR